MFQGMSWAPNLADTTHSIMGSVVTGTAKDEIIRGTSSNDIIDGGGGNDRVEFNGAYGQDHVTGAETLVIDGRELRGNAIDDGAGHYSLNGLKLEVDGNGALKVYGKDGASSITIDDWDASTNNYGILTPTISSGSSQMVWLKFAYIWEPVTIDTTTGTIGDYIVANSINQGTSPIPGDVRYTGQSNVTTVNGNYTTYYLAKGTLMDVIAASALSYTPVNTGNAWVVAHSTAYNEDSILSTAAEQWVYQGGTLHDANNNGYDDYGMMDTQGVTGIYMVGSAANDSLYGSSADDVFIGGGGIDVLVGYMGYDKYIFNGDFGNDLVFDDDGSGSVTIDGVTLGATQSAVQVATDTWLLDGHTLQLSSADTLSIHSNGAVNIYNFTSGDLGITLGSSDVSINGGAGDDLLYSGIGADTINGGYGADTLSYEYSSAAVQVNLTTNINTGGSAQGDSISGIEHLVGSAYADTLTGNAGANIIYGNDGADTITGAGGDDTLVGGPGEDLFVFESGTGNVVISDFIGAGGTGGDVISIASAIDGTSIATAADVLNYVSYVDGDAVISLGTGHTITLVGINNLQAGDFSVV